MGRIGTTSPPRFYALDSWRGIAAVMVALFHMPIAWSLYDVGIVRHAWLFVDFFFVLSGFVIAFTYENRIADRREFADFMIRRFGRVWPLHAAVLLALVVLQIIILILTQYAHFPAPNNKPFEGPWNSWAILENLFLVHSLGLMPGPGTWNTPSWSISVEFYTYVVFGLAVLFASRRIIIISAMISIMGLVTLSLLSNVYLASTTQWGFERCLYGFFLGVMTFHVEANMPKMPAALANTVELIILVCAVIFVWGVGLSPMTLGAPLLFALVVLVFSREAGLVSRALVTRPFLWLGERSYTIYMLHLSVFIVLNYATRAVEQYSHKSLTTIAKGFNSMELVTDRTIIDFGSVLLNDLIGLFTILLIFALAAVIYRTIEVPARDFFKRKSQAYAVDRESTHKQAWLA